MGEVADWIALGGLLVSIATLVAVVVGNSRASSRLRRIKWWVQARETVDDGTSLAHVVELRWSGDGYMLNYMIAGAKEIARHIPEVGNHGFVIGPVRAGDVFRTLVETDDIDRAWIVVAEIVPDSGELVRVGWQPLSVDSKLPMEPFKTRWRWAGGRLMRAPRAAEVGPGRAAVTTLNERERKAMLDQVMRAASKVPRAGLS